jgi:hypothetical protein
MGAGGTEIPTYLIAPYFEFFYLSPAQALPRALVTNRHFFISRYGSSKHSLNPPHFPSQEIDPSQLDQQPKFMSHIIIASLVFPHFIQ